VPVARRLSASNAMARRTTHFICADDKLLCQTDVANEMPDKSRLSQDAAADVKQ
jgi:hypothetical protein